MNLDNLITVDSIKVGSSAIIEKITAPSELKGRLLSLGFIRGNSIKLDAKSIAAETIVVKLGSINSYALRAIEAKYIYVKQ